MDEQKTENAETDDAWDPEGDPWDDEAANTIAMAAPSIDSSIPSPISSHPPSMAPLSAGGVPASKKAPSLQALAVAQGAAPLEEAELEEAELEEAELEEAELVEEPAPHRHGSVRSAGSSAIAAKRSSASGVKAAPQAATTDSASKVAAPRPGFGGTGRFPSVPRAATALAAPLGFGSKAEHPATAKRVSAPPPPLPEEQPGPTVVPAPLVAAPAIDDEEDAATRASSREEFLGIEEVEPLLSSSPPEEATHALATSPLEMPAHGGLPRISPTPGFPQGPAHAAPAPGPREPGVFAWGRAPAGGAPAPAPFAPPPPQAMPAPAPMSSQRGGPAEPLYRTHSGSAPGAPVNMTRSGAWAPAGQGAQPWMQPPTVIQRGEPLRITGATIFFTAIALVCLAVFVIGVVLFATTTF